MTVRTLIFIIALCLLVMFTYAIDFVRTEIDPLEPTQLTIVDREPHFHGNPKLALKYTIHY